MFFGSKWFTKYSFSRCFIFLLQLASDGADFCRKAGLAVGEDSDGGSPEAAVRCFDFSEPSLEHGLCPPRRTGERKSTADGEEGGMGRLVWYAGLGLIVLGAVNHMNQRLRKLQEGPESHPLDEEEDDDVDSPMAEREGVPGRGIPRNSRLLRRDL